MIDFEYDANGNRVTRQSNSGALTEYTYDIENHLIHVISDTNRIITFEYDGDGNRLKEIYNDTNDSAIYVSGYYEVAPWSDNTSIYGETGNRQLNPNMVNGDDGTLYLVWVERLSEYTSEVRFATRNPATEGWSSPYSVDSIPPFLCTRSGKNRFS